MPCTILARSDENFRSYEQLYISLDCHLSGFSEIAGFQTFYCSYVVFGATAVLRERWCHADSKSALGFECRDFQTRKKWKKLVKMWTFLPTFNFLVPVFKDFQQFNSKCSPRHTL